MKKTVYLKHFLFHLSTCFSLLLIGLASMRLSFIRLKGILNRNESYIAENIWSWIFIVLGVILLICLLITGARFRKKNQINKTIGFFIYWVGYAIPTAILILFYPQLFYSLL